MYENNRARDIEERSGLTLGRMLFSFYKVLRIDFDKRRSALDN